MAIEAKDKGAAILERVIIEGDLSKLTPAERVFYYQRVCESLNLNPLTKPFDYLWLRAGRGEEGEAGKKLILYARRDATDQIRFHKGISVEITSREFANDLYIVTAKARDKADRTDQSIGAVSVKGLAGEFLANAIMKAETKAKRRVTLSFVGLGWMDESEVDAVPEAEPAKVDVKTGEIATLPAMETDKGKALSILLDMAASFGLSSKDLRARAKTQFGKESSNDLTAEELTQLAATIEADFKEDAKAAEQDR